MLFYNIVHINEMFLDVFVTKLLLFQDLDSYGSGYMGLAKEEVVP